LTLTEKWQFGIFLTKTLPLNKGFRMI